MEKVRKYGKPPFNVAVIHGGPGAPGSVAPVARELSTRWGVMEPLQSADTCEGQVLELKAVLEENAALPVTLIGHSWGAILSYITTARYPALVRKLILIGTPSFAGRYVADVFSDRLNRLTKKERAEVLSLEKFIWDGVEEDKSVSMGRLFRLLAKVDSYDLILGKDEVLEYQLDISISVGLELRKLLNGKDLLKIGRGIRCPLVAIQGDDDPRLAEGVRELLSRVLKDFRFILLEKCGHYPWLEKYARDRFYEILKGEIA
jgi:pimeloyl-ACP methyl ester carboxylesterase